MYHMLSFTCSPAQTKRSLSSFRILPFLQWENRTVEQPESEARSCGNVPIVDISGRSHTELI